MTAKKPQKTSTHSLKPTAIDLRVFREMMADRTAVLLRSAEYLVNQHGVFILTRPLLAELLSQATLVEELLDSYGAKNNREWLPFRSVVAAIKLFTSVSYVLLHIRHALPAYRLLPIPNDFAGDTERALAFTDGVLMIAAADLLEQAQELQLPRSTVFLDQDVYEEHLPPGRLPSDRPHRSVENVAETVTYLATAFLNLAAESEFLHVPSQVAPPDYASCIPREISEDRLRQMQHRFHNLQSLYDTYISETEAENLDPDLPVLRGHISVIFHLLETATEMAHHYQRHISPELASENKRQSVRVPPQELLRTLMDYSVAYSSRYLTCARSLCQQMLNRYTEVDRMELPVPRYRGFHVRPSTLVARIVQYYGSKTIMELDGDQYDASSPIEIFRANEKINARKRHWLAEAITHLPEVQAGRKRKSFRSVIWSVIMTLAEQGKVVIYEHPLQVRTEPCDPDTPLLEAVTAEIARLQATGKIDIAVPLNAVFIGDKRVLQDIELLANAGYGEDNFGNNIALPEKLSHLRR